MALSGNAYGNFIIKSLSKEIDYLTEDIKIMLVKDTYTPDEDTHIYLSSVRSHEVANGDGYSTGGITLTNKFLNYDAITNTISLGADNVTWSNSSITARYAVIYDDSPATDNIKPLIAYVDMGRNYTSSESDFSLLWNDNVILILQDILDLINSFQLVSKMCRLDITGIINPNTPFSTSNSGTNYIKSLDSVPLGVDENDFNNNLIVIVLYNGVEMLKISDVAYISEYSISFPSITLDTGDVVIIKG